MRTGLFAPIAVIFASSALTLGLVGGFGCANLVFKPLDAFESTLPDLKVGFWNTRDYEYLGVNSDNEIVVKKSCQSYPDSADQDSKWKAAMSFSIISVVIGSILAVLTCLQAGDAGPNLSKAIGAGYMLNTLFQGLTLIVLGSNMCTDNPIFEGIPAAAGSYNTECDWSAGFKCNISATVCWFAAGLCMCAIGKAGGDGAAANEREVEGEPAKDEEAIKPDDEPAVMEEE